MSDEPTPHARIYLTPPCCGNYEHGEVTWCEDAANECGNCGAQPTAYVPESRIDAAERIVRMRDRQMEQSTRYWVRCAERALAGDTGPLRNRIDMHKEPPLEVSLSDAALTANHSEHGAGK